MPNNSDVNDSGNGWLYSDQVKEHFFNPRNFVVKGEPEGDFNGLGMIGNPACGDMMRIWLKIDRKTELIEDCMWQTFGCASAIATTSVLSEIIKGKTIEEALLIGPEDILKDLGGLPKRKIHCSVLGDKALRAAINDFFRRTGQESRMVDESARIIDKILKITDKDIEEAVKSGAANLSQVQAVTKVGSGDPACLPQVEELIRFYREKYYN
jgi:nitrogen fixation NifU-like protein